jgi:hypothetical protein
MTMPTTAAPDYTQLADQVARAFQDAFASTIGARSRDFGSDVIAPTVPSPVPTAAESGDKFFPLAAVLLPAVVSAMPSIIQAIQGQNRDLITPSRDPEDVQRDFLSVLSAIVPQVLQSIPGIISTFSGSRDLPRNDEEVATRWFGGLMSVFVPQLIQAVPPLVSAFAGGRRDLLPSTRATDPEVATRFFGPLLGGLAGPLMQSLPQVISMFTGQRYVPQS